jgi:hypothetical protein
MKINKQTKDPVNQRLIELEELIGLQTLGVMNNAVWYEDPKRLVFTLARYKFVAKMFADKQQVAEIGCGDGFGSRIVRQEVGELLITDYDPYFISKFKEQTVEHLEICSKTHDILIGPLDTQKDAIYSLDVLEHIQTDLENTFLKNISLSLKNNGCAIIGMPSLESQIYASAASREGHVNCKSGKELQNLLRNFFENVFIFSMNDEVVHTGFSKMAHYLLALCITPIRNK